MLTLISRRRIVPDLKCPAGKLEQTQRFFPSSAFEKALVDLDRELSVKDSKIVHILHDEIITEARENISSDIAIALKNSMDRTFGEILPEVPFMVNPNTRVSWG